MKKLAYIALVTVALLGYNFWVGTIAATAMLENNEELLALSLALAAAGGAAVVAYILKVAIDEQR